MPWGLLVTWGVPQKGLFLEKIKEAQFPCARQVTLRPRSAQSLCTALQRNELGRRTKWTKEPAHKGTAGDSGKWACLSFSHEQQPEAFTGYVWNSHLTAQFYLISKEGLSSMLFKQFHKIEEKEMSRLRSSCLLWICLSCSRPPDSFWEAMCT